MSGSQHTSEQFGAEMGNGWKGAIKYKFEKVKVLNETKIKKNDSNDAGDVDVAFKFKEETPLLSILPEKCFYRPDIRHKNISVKYYLAEIKRSCPLQHEKQNIKQFVRFYHSLFDPHKNTDLRLDNAPTLIQKAVVDSNTVLLFVFNSADNVAVADTMQKEIKKVTNDENCLIMGHQVITVWCSLAEMIKWKESLEMKDLLEEKDAEITRLKRILAEKDKSRKRKKLS